MTPIQKAKEIWIAITDFWFNGKAEDELKSKRDLTFHKWLQTPEAAAILSGEDWISVEKPPKGKDFYMTFDPNYLEQPIGIAYYQPYNDSWINDGGDEFHPSHYLPLPEPPKP